MNLSVYSNYLKSIRHRHCYYLSIVFCALHLVALTPYARKSTQFLLLTIQFDDISPDTNFSPSSELTVWFSFTSLILYSLHVNWLIATVYRKVYFQNMRTKEFLHLESHLSFRVLIHELVHLNRDLAY